MKFEKGDQYIKNIKRFGDKPSKKLIERCKLNYESLKQKLNLVESSDVSTGGWTALKKNSIEKQGVYFSSHEEQKVPFEDHSRMHKDTNGKRYLIFHPYNVEEDQINNWCQLRGLKASIYNESLSWYNPDRTFTVVVQIEDEDKYNAYIKDIIQAKRR